MIPFNVEESSRESKESEGQGRVRSMVWARALRTKDSNPSPSTCTVRPEPCLLEGGICQMGGAEGHLPRATGDIERDKDLIGSQASAECERRPHRWRATAW